MKNTSCMRWWEHLMRVLLLVRVAASSPWHEELCRSVLNSSLHDNDTTERDLNLNLHHTFLKTERGLVPGVVYNVSLRPFNAASSFAFLLTSVPRGAFLELPDGVQKCENIEGTVIGRSASIGRVLHLQFVVESSTNESLVLILRTTSTRKKILSTTIFNYHMRSDYYYIVPTEELVLSSAKLNADAVLVQSPHSTALEIKFQDLTIANESKRTIVYNNVSESTIGGILDSSIALDKEDFTFLIREGNFFLIQLSQCSRCNLVFEITPVVTTFECNSTLRSLRGVLQLWSNHGFCQLFIEAPSHYRVLLELRQSLPLKGNACSTHKLLLDHVAPKSEQRVWYPCSNTSLPSTEFYISQSNHLNLEWTNIAEGSGPLRTLWSPTLHYQFFSPCSDRIYKDSARGHFCNPGYPHFYLECNASYAIYVPYGYAVELELTVMGLFVGAFCPEPTLEMTTRNAGHWEDMPFGPCVNVSSFNQQLLTYRTTSNVMHIRARGGQDAPGKGFCARFKAVPLQPALTRECDFAWIAGHKFCYAVLDQELPWADADAVCRREGGHLASITDPSISLLIDDLIRNSPTVEGYNAFWIGANDLTYENCFEWADGQVFDFDFWFPGWKNYGGYSIQPSDDGMSHQNCVELRNLFRYPSKGEGTTERFYWNDRDCQVNNPFICQRLKPGVSFEPVKSAICNRTIFLTLEHPQDIIVSPGFPSNYPNNLECHYHIVATTPHRIVAQFTDFIIEGSDSCAYDHLSMYENTEKEVIWRRCGDWESRIKLLRHTSSQNSLGFVFFSDFSHSFRGFRIKLSLYTEKLSGSQLCDNDMFQLKKQNCYLVVDYPETSWTTARQICSEARAKLVDVESAEEVEVLDELVRATYGYTSGVIYWTGAFSSGNGTWKWLDGTTLQLQQMHITRNEDFQGPKTPSCLAIQWKQMRNKNSLRWIAKNCHTPGRFICEKPSIFLPSDLNRTITELSGNLTSINYPSNYLDDVDYTVRFKGPPNSRIVITFLHFDLEWQEDCLYDFIHMSSNKGGKGVQICGTHFKEREEFVSNSDEAYFTFHSDFSISASGFVVSWEVVDLSSCINSRILVIDSTSITSLRYPRDYIKGVDCSSTLTASHTKNKLVFTIIDLDIVSCSDDFLEINLDPSQSRRSVILCGNQYSAGSQFISYANEAEILFRSSLEKEMERVSSRGYNITCESLNIDKLKTVLSLKAADSIGKIWSLNFNHQQPTGLNYSKRVVVPLGYKIHLLHLNISQTTSQKRTQCEGSGLLVRDSYANHKEILLWKQCNTSTVFESGGILSTLNILTIDAWNYDDTLPPYFFEYAVVKDADILNTTLNLPADSIESCNPNPCVHGGKCLTNGSVYSCTCPLQFTGLFCHLTWCEVNPCGEFGFCNLTATGFICECLLGHTGSLCQLVTTPCQPNPCDPNGFCTVKNESFNCACRQDFEGTRCEKFVIRIPYKPLSQRMLEEPFWLGLITVFSVLMVILFVYCIKRKFADKIEKFLADEIERSKYQPSPPAARYSLSSTHQCLNQGSQSPPNGQRSLLNRIRKNSILSTSYSPGATTEREQSRTFSFDDILRRVHSSKRHTSRDSSNAQGIGSSSSHESAAREQSSKDEKSRILASLVTPSKDPAVRRMSLDEFFRMSERKLQFNAKREDDIIEETDVNEGGLKETSFISEPHYKSIRQTFTEQESIQEYVSSSDSSNGEPRLGEIQADVSPNSYSRESEHNNSNNSSDNEKIEETTPFPTCSNGSEKETTEHPQICITIESCDADIHEAPVLVKESNKDLCLPSQQKSPVTSISSSYLQVPPLIPSIKVFCADTPDNANATCSSSLQNSNSRSSFCKPDFVHPRKHSVDLPIPKILITANRNSCDSDESSPPRTPNPNKSMMYLSPLAVISSSTDRTISESNLSTSGYSSISSPGLSRCNSSSPISDDVENNAANLQTNLKAELQSPKKAQSHGIQMTYLSMGGNDKTFFFPPTITCHCHEMTTPNQPSLMLDSKNPQTTPAAWRGSNIRQTVDKHRLLHKRNSYQTTSTDDSIDDEGIGMDTIDFKIRKGEVRSAHDLEMYIASEKHEKEEWDFKNPLPSPSVPNIIIDSGKGDLLPSPISKSGSSTNLKGSPRPIVRKTEKGKKHGDKPRRSPVLSPVGTPVKDQSENVEIKISRNSSRTSMSGVLLSSSESEDTENYVGTRQKNQSRRLKKQHDGFSHHSTACKSEIFPVPESKNRRMGQNWDENGRSSPMSESNGDSAPMDSRSLGTSSSESLKSTKDSGSDNTKIKDISKSYCNRHRFALEHSSCSFPPLNQTYDSSKHSFLKYMPVATVNTLKLDDSSTKYGATAQNLPTFSFNLDEEGDSSPLGFEEPLHPCLRRQDAVIEDDPSDDSSSETTVLLRRPTSSFLHQSSSQSPDASEWTTDDKDFTFDCMSSDNL